MTAMISLDLNATDPILRIEPDLREIEVGDNLEGKRFEEIDTSREDLKKWVYLIEDTYHEKFQTEPLSNFIKRTGDAFSKIVNQGEEDSDDTILIFSHGGTMRSILSQTLQLIAPENFSIRNTEIICIKLKDNNWKLVERITSHLNA